MQQQEKSRALGHSQQKQSQPEQELPEETVELLRQYQERFTRNVNNSMNRIERIEMLMKRKHGSKKWTPTKMAKMIRRIQSAHKVTEENANMLQHVTSRLQDHQHVYTPSV